MTEEVEFKCAAEERSIDVTEEERAEAAKENGDDGVMEDEELISERG